MFWIDKVEEEKLIIKIMFLFFFSKKKEKNIAVFIKKIGEGKKLVNPFT